MTIFAVTTKGQVIDAHGTKFFLNRNSAEEYRHNFDKLGDCALVTYHDPILHAQTYEHICCSAQAIKNLRDEVSRFNRCNAYQKDKVYATIEWVGTKIKNEYHIVEIEVEE